jgi:uncharacterized protein YigE (DUF2233 family)
VIGSSGGRLAAAVALSLAVLTPAAAEAACREEAFEGTGYAVCSFDLSRTDLRLFWRNADKKPYGSFAALAEDLTERGLTLRFAMNGGMYQEDLTPVGLYVERGEELKRVNRADGPAGIQPVPNFYKKPNGIFYAGDGRAGVLETEAYLSEKPSAEFATQSGPMLLIDGKIHPAFIVGSTDRKPRNGVCAKNPAEVHFVITDERVNFYDFARFFRDRLGCRDALFLDGGSAPGLYAPELGRSDRPPWEGYGPIIGVVGE